MSNMLHKGGLPELFSEVGFSVVKYFEGTISSTATTIDLDPPCKRVVIRNTDFTSAVYLRVDGQPAVASVGMLPGDNIKVAGLGVFVMDFDTVHSISLITASGTVFIEGILGYKGYL